MSKTFEEIKQGFVDQIDDCFQRTHNQCPTAVGIESLDGAGISFSYPNVTYIGAPVDSGQFAVLSALAVNQSVYQKKLSLTLSMGWPRNRLPSLFFAQLTAIPYYKIERGDLASDEWRKIADALRMFKSSVAYIAEHPMAKKSNVKRAIVELVNKSIGNEKSLHVVFLSGIEAVGENWEGKYGLEAYEAFSEFIISLAVDYNVHIVTDWPIVKRNNDRNSVSLADLVCHESIIESGAQVITIFRRSLYQKGGNVKAREMLVLTAYDPKYWRLCAFNVDMCSRSHKIYGWW